MKTNAMHLTNIELFQILKEKLGEKEAESVVSFVESKVAEEFESKRDTLATKKDIYDLSEKLSEKMGSHFKWIIGLFLGQMAFVVGLVYFILNFAK